MVYLMDTDTIMAEIPRISENIINMLTQLYPGKDQNELLKILSTPPNVSILRVSNTEDLKTRKILIQHLEENCFSLSSHLKIPDAMVITKNKIIGEDFPVGKEVIVDTSCGSAVLRGANVFAPGVLAADKTMKSGDMVSVFADLDKNCRRGLITKYDGNKFFVGNGVALFDRQHLFQNNTKLSGVAIKMSEKSRKHPTLPKLHGVYPQNLPSIVVGHVLNPEDGDLILDMCAAPGGKSTHAGELLKGKTGTIISIDKTNRKVDVIKENCQTLKLDNVKCYCFDSTKLLVQDPLTQKRSVVDGPPFKPSTFNKILLDPPCSGFGQRPQLRYVMTEKELASYSVYQRKLIAVAIDLLKEGGSLIYSTCTLLPSENEMQVSWILNTYPQMKLVNQVPFLGQEGLKGYNLSDSDCTKVQRFDWIFTSGELPIDASVEDKCKDSIGFFIAKFVKLKRE